MQGKGVREKNTILRRTDKGVTEKKSLSPLEPRASGRLLSASASSLVAVRLVRCGLQP